MDNYLRDFEIQLESNEFFYRVAGCFWAQQYYLLEDKIATIEEDIEISVKGAIKKFSKGILSILKNTHLPYKIISKKDYRYYLFYLESVYVGVNKKKGDIIVKAEHIMSKQFSCEEYAAALIWIQAYLDIDTQPLNSLHMYIQDKFSLNVGADEIAKTSLLSLTQMVLNEKKIPFKIKQNPLWSEIYIKKSDSQIYRLNIFHKAFNSNPELLLNQLSDPHEEYIKDEIECIKIDSYNFNDPESIAISLSK